jgi:cell wall-associated NlpC family hydrolase
MRFLSFLLIIISFAGCISSAPRFSSSAPSPASGRETTLETDRSSEQISVHQRIDTTTLMRVITQFLGTPYCRGGETDDGLDCSAFTRLVFDKAFMIHLPRSTEEQYTVGEIIGKNDIVPGDLVFFNTTGRNPSHVGIYIGDGLFAHASVTEGVTISSMSSAYYNDRYESARRIIKHVQ